jgi:hypothetical protein
MALSSGSFKKGHLVTKEVREKIGNSNRGKTRTLTEEHKIKIGLANTGCNNGNWKGDCVSYPVLHAWVKRHFPKPTLCTDCSQKPPYDLANISGLYKRDVADFEWLCRSCHMKKETRKKHLGEWSHKHKGDVEAFNKKEKI